MNEEKKFEKIYQIKESVIDELVQKLKGNPVVGYEYPMKREEQKCDCGGECSNCQEHQTDIPTCGPVAPEHVPKVKPEKMPDSACKVLERLRKMVPPDYIRGVSDEGGKVVMYLYNGVSPLNNFCIGDATNMDRFNKYLDEIKQPDRTVIRTQDFFRADDDKSFFIVFTTIDGKQCNETYCLLNGATQSGLGVERSSVVFEYKFPICRCWGEVAGVVDSRVRSAYGSGMIHKALKLVYEFYQSGEKWAEKHKTEAGYTVSVMGTTEKCNVVHDEDWDIFGNSPESRFGDVMRFIDSIVPSGVFVKVTPKDKAPFYITRQVVGHNKILISNNLAKLRWFKQHEDEVTITLADRRDLVPSDYDWIIIIRCEFNPLMNLLGAVQHYVTPFWFKPGDELPPQCVKKWTHEHLVENEGSINYRQTVRDLCWIEMTSSVETGLELPPLLMPLMELYKFYIAVKMSGEDQIEKIKHVVHLAHAHLVN